MAKKEQTQDQEFTLPPESITKGGSYLVDPVAGKAERKEFTRPQDLQLGPAPQSVKQAQAVTDTQQPTE